MDLGGGGAVHLFSIQSAKQPFAKYSMLLWILHELQLSVLFPSVWTPLMDCGSQINVCIGEDVAVPGPARVDW